MFKNFQKKTIRREKMKRFPSLDENFKNLSCILFVFENLALPVLGIFLFLNDSFSPLKNEPKNSLLSINQEFLLISMRVQFEKVFFTRKKGGEL